VRRIVVPSWTSIESLVGSRCRGHRRTARVLFRRERAHHPAVEVPISVTCRRERSGEIETPRIEPVTAAGCERGACDECGCEESHAVRRGRIGGGVDGETRAVQCLLR
jgi:hypothetical protein